jgi:medium-chain acyl-[acyl-carrier-protein] hydrolase
VLDLVDWRGHTRRPFSLRMFPGGHFYLGSARAPLVQAIAQDWRAAATGPPWE